MIQTQTKTLENSQIYGDIGDTIQKLFPDIGLVKCFMPNTLYLNKEIIAAAQLLPGIKWSHFQFVELVAGDTLYRSHQKLFTVSEAGTYRIEIYGNQATLSQVASHSLGEAW